MRVTPILAAALLTAGAAGVYAQMTPPQDDQQNSAQLSDQQATPSQDEADKNSPNQSSQSATESQDASPDNQTDANNQSTEAPPAR
jgi:hypothetical protein